MQTTPRPLPRIPPQLNLPHPADVRSYRPLPTPPLQPDDCTSSIESVYLQTPPTGTTSLPNARLPRHIPCDSSSSSASFSTSSEPLPKSRPRLYISVASPTHRERNPDSLTVRSSALCDPGQALSSAVGCGNDTLTTDPSPLKRSPRVSKKSGRVSPVKPFISPLVFGGTTASEEGSKSALTHILLILPPTHLTIPVPRIPEPTKHTPGPAVNPQPPRSRPTPILTDRIGTHFPVAATRVVAGYISDSDDDDKFADATSDRESRTSNERSRKPFQNIVKLAKKTRLFRLRTRPTKSGDAPVADAKRISQMASPLNQTWYKELDGWRWVERDVGEVLAELRKLR